MEAIRDFALTFLLNAIWQGTLVLLLAIGCQHLLRRATAHAQHLCWAGALVLAVCLPVLTMFYTTGRALPEEIAPASDRSTIAGPAHVINVSSRKALLADAMLAAYGLLVLWGAVRLFRRGQSTRRLLAEAQTVQLPEPVLAISERCSVRFGLPLIPIACSPDCAGPLTAGALDPVIVVPRAMIDEASETVLSTLLGHEMAHIKRHDYLLNIFYEVSSLPLWFLPGIQRMKREIDRTRELACDEMAAPYVTPVAYARSLVDVAGAMVTVREPAYSLGALDGNVLEERVKRLLEKGKRRMRIWGWFPMSALGAAAFVALFFPILINGGQGSLRGIVRDPSGAVVDLSAEVLLRDLSTGIERSVRTDAVGVFEFLNLPAGCYEVSVRAKHFRQFRTMSVTVGAMRSPRMAVVLELGRISETLTVIGS